MAEPAVEREPRKGRASGGMDEPPANRLTETEFQRQVTDLAELYGWEWVHFRPAQTARGWRTPVSGPLGSGWVDLVLVRGRRLVFAELKTDIGKTTLDQFRVLTVLTGIAAGTRDGGVEVYVWRPADFDRIVEILR